MDGKEYTNPDRLRTRPKRPVSGVRQRRYNRTHGRPDDLQASNVPGIREDVYVAGAKVLRSYPFGPLPGCAVMVAMVTHGETCCVGVNADPAAVVNLVERLRLAANR